jgi:hypothetical protein
MNAFLQIDACLCHARKIPTVEARVQPTENNGNNFPKVNGERKRRRRTDTNSIVQKSSSAMSAAVHDGPQNFNPWLRVRDIVPQGY